ncbi:MAG: beta-galactosidase [Tepidisphaeraceae bacterium]
MITTNSRKSFKAVTTIADFIATLRPQHYIALMLLKPTLLASLVIVTAVVASAADIDLTAPIPPPMAGHLKMGGTNPQGVEINVDNRSITVGGKPWLPVMGEMHYSRYPHEEWEQELLKMKAGGINIVSAYIFWIHHEEVENQWDWTGDKDLRAFVQLCAKHGLYVYLRLGPWDHGEARNGGLPDWLMAKIPARQLRTTAPAFMDEVRTLYTQEFTQVKGLLYKDGGPIVGVQVENEERNAAPYLLALKNLAKEVGFDVPLYSMTGWGPARVPQDELLPMFGGYTDGFWIDGHQIAPASRIQFFFTHNPSDEGTRMSSRPGPAPASMAYLARYPFLTCEIGGGMAIAYARRPIIAWQDVASEALCKLADGSNLMGYYMYQGGGNPPGKLSTLQETQATNYPNDLPVVDYDFQAPLGQFGQERQVYHALRVMHMFLADFGADLATMPSTLPDPKQMPKDLNDTETLRWAVRSDGHRGYIFINNYQRGTPMAAKPAQFNLKLPDGVQTVPAAPVTIPADSFMFWPFNFDLNGVNLRYATAQPICRVELAGSPVYFFMANPGVEPTFAISTTTLGIMNASPDVKRTVQGDITVLSGFKPGLDCVFDVHTPDRSKFANIVLVTQEQAQQLWKANIWGAPRVLWSPANLVFDDSRLTLLTSNPQDMTVGAFPPQANRLTCDRAITDGSNGVFIDYTLAVPTKTVAVDFKQIQPAGPARELHSGSKNKPEEPSDADFAAAAVWQITIPPDALDGASEVRLKIDYAGDAARAYIGDRLIDDDFYYGKPWEIGLKRFAPDVLSKGITLKILPLRADSTVNIAQEVWPKPGPDGSSLELRGITAEVEYSATLEGAK